MKINKIQLVKIAVVILYLLFFLLMQELFANIENSPYTMMSLDENFYRLFALKLALTKFFQWFVLGVLLAFLNVKDRPSFHFTKGLFLIAMAWMVLAFMGLYPNVVIMSFPNSKFLELLRNVVPIFSGFFLFKSLFDEEKIICSDRN
ncbi:hypothetical protein [Acetobacterium tundrae]|uniref:Uncharacterized protein n=1 Tax=Acetobacterium tundrae TaxID=132932 RepID=A0ABR6WJB5_9FIRM|nr:hypothetical protein [Acetobacterium tundrae]MBC3796242.1 hypothetical protein [Acetobacterium tundrae]